MKPIISFKNFSFKYRSLSEPTLKNINLDVYKGERILIAGPSGSGKSTLAHCINGLIPFAYHGDIQGEALVNGIEPHKSSIFEISKSVGTILQDQDGQFIGLSVGEDVAFASENEMVPQDVMIKEVKTALDAVEMSEFVNKSPYELSGGQKQRVSLAGVLATEADILLFDEPLANLDPASGRRAMEIINEIHKKTGKTIIIIEHRIEEVLEQPIDKVVVISEGEIKGMGTPDEILASDILRASGLREPLYIEAAKYAGCRLDASDGLSNMKNLKVDKYELPLTSWYNSGEKLEEREIRDVVLSLKNIRFSYDGIEEVIKDISFDVHEGEIIAILGNNGAGKSTISNLITGIKKPDSGSILFCNEDISSWSIKKRGQHIGYVMQNPNHMITQHMIKEEVGLGLAARGIDSVKIGGRVDEALRTCGLYPYRNWPVSALSYGQKKRLTIASILALEPKVLILDEPTAGQDYKHYTEFMEFIKELTNKGIAIILITHDMHLAMEYTDRAIVISEGGKIADDLVSSILTNGEIISKANLKETSLSKLSEILDIHDPNGFVQHFIDCERRGRRHA